MKHNPAKIIPLIQRPWFLYAVFALIMVCIVDLGKKYILDKKIIKQPRHLVIYLSIIVGFLGLIHYIMDDSCNSIFSCKSEMLILLFFISLCVYIFNISFTTSLKLSPDVTLPCIMISLSIIFIYLVSSIYFDASPPFDWHVLLGIILTVTGLGIITNYFKG
tara:strand:- start:1240 stop:1725 length:486 start_codon:yes stop_codon:yes gene_type:complete